MLIAGVLLALGVGLTLTPAGGQAADTTTPTSVVLRMTGSMTMTLDTSFAKTVKQAKAKVSVKGGATLSKRTITLPVDTSTTVTTSPATADILGTGTVMLRRSDGRKLLAQDITLRLRDSGADVGGSLRGRPGKQFAALTVSPTTAVQQTESGYQFIGLQMLVSDDLVTAARRAHLKGFKAGALLGLLDVQVRADIPTLTLPGISIPGVGTVNTSSDDVSDLFT
ncbi:MAG: hypothetical protein QM679_11600 [Patulibacter sp.]